MTRCVTCSAWTKQRTFPYRLSCLLILRSWLPRSVLSMTRRLVPLAATRFTIQLCGRISCRSGFVSVVTIVGSHGVGLGRRFSAATRGYQGHKL